MFEVIARKPPEKGFKVVASRNLQRDEIILTTKLEKESINAIKPLEWFPEKILDQIKKLTSRTTYPAFDKQVLEFVLLSLRILQERNLGRKSQFDKFLSSLPTSFDIGCHEITDDDNCLSPRQKDILHNKYYACFLLNDVVNKIGGKIKPPIEKSKHVEWAASIAVTRRVGNCLSPLLSLLNHNLLHGATLNLVNGEATNLVAQQDIERGEEIFLRYGYLSPEDMSMSYEFLPKESYHYRGLVIRMLEDQFGKSEGDVPYFFCATDFPMFFFSPNHPKSSQCLKGKPNPPLLKFFQEKKHQGESFKLIQNISEIMQRDISEHKVLLRNNCTSQKLTKLSHDSH